MRLAHNALNGTLPDAFANMMALDTLDLSYNNLTGSLPAAWARMRTASTTGKAPEVRGVSLQLSHNALYGTLPAEWGVSTGGMSMALTTLDVSYNTLGGGHVHRCTACSVQMPAAMIVCACCLCTS